MIIALVIISANQKRAAVRKIAVPFLDLKKAIAKQIVPLKKIALMTKQNKLNQNFAKMIVKYFMGTVSFLVATNTKKKKREKAVTIPVMKSL